jgi:hypothetical protein
MTAAAALPPIDGKTTVNVPVEQAFTVFTESFTTWWPDQDVARHDRFLAGR